MGATFPDRDQGNKSDAQQAADKAPAPRVNVGAFLTPGVAHVARVRYTSRPADENREDCLPRRLTIGVVSVQGRGRKRRRFGLKEIPSSPPAERLENLAIIFFGAC